MTAAIAEFCPPLLAATAPACPVPLHDGTTTRYVNLDLAASAPALAVVSDEVRCSLAWYASIHRGAGYLSQVSTAAYEQARDDVRRFVGAHGSDHLIFTRNTTDSLNLLARVVPIGASVLVLDIEHHANLLPWRRGSATTLPAADTVAATIKAVAAELARREYALLAVSGMSNVTGERLPLAELAAVAHRHGARIAVDGAQLVPHHGIDLLQTGVDYVAFSGHKLYAPFGAGVLVGPADWFDIGPAYLAGGGAVRDVSRHHTEWTDGAARHEGGSPNALGAVAIAAACRALTAIGPEAITAHEHALQDQLEDGLRSIAAIVPARIWTDSVQPTGVATFTLPGLPAALVAAVLSAEHGIGVRDGRFCAHPLLARLGLNEGAVRVSFGVTTGSQDIELLLRALRELAATGPRASYHRTVGGWAPTVDLRTLPAHLGGGPLSRGQSPCDQRQGLASLRR